MDDRPSVPGCPAISQLPDAVPSGSTVARLPPVLTPFALPLLAVERMSRGSARTGMPPPTAPPGCGKAIRQVAGAEAMARATQPGEGLPPGREGCLYLLLSEYSLDYGNDVKKQIQAIL
ncbi:hypothetical protein AAY473_006564 [Plecturocebus cupreus]